MKAKNPQIPGYLKLLWMLLMQPVHLHQLLQRCGIDNPNILLWQLLEPSAASAPSSPMYRVYIRRMELLLVLVVPGLMLLTAGLLQLLGHSVNLALLGTIIAGGLIWGLSFSSSFDLAGGIALGIAFIVSSELLIGIAKLEVEPALLGVLLGVSGGFGANAALGLIGMTWTLTWSLIHSLALGLTAGLVQYIILDSTTAIYLGLGVGLSFFLFVLRLPFYPIEVIIQSALYLLQKLGGYSTLRYIPVLHHDLSYLPHPFLKAHLLLNLYQDPDLVHQVLQACTIAPGQRRLLQSISDSVNLDFDKSKSTCSISTSSTQGREEQRLRRNINEIPGYWRLLWMLFMQPIQLRQCLESCGIHFFDHSLLGLNQISGTQSYIQLVYLRRLALLVFTVIPIGALLVTGCLWLVGYPISWLHVVQGIVLGISTGTAFGIIGSVAFGVSGSATFGTALGIVLGVFGVTGFTAPGGLTVGILAGLAFGSTLSVVFGMIQGSPMNPKLALGLSATGSFTLGIFLGILIEPEQGILAGLAYGAVFIPTIFHLFTYPVEALFQTFLYLLQRLSGFPTLYFTPVLHHDLSHLPYPFLGSHLLLNVHTEPGLLRKLLLNAGVNILGQRHVARKVLTRLQFLELETLVKQQRFAEIAALEGYWLPRTERTDTDLSAFQEAGRYLVASESAVTAYHRLESLNKVKAIVTGLENASPRQHPALRQAIRTLRAVTDKLHQEAKAIADQQIPNPFRAGDPLTPDAGQELFKGRANLVQRIESLITDPTRSSSIMLLGPRRCGKTSLLKMLPVLLPDVLCIFFDLQDNPVDSPRAFFNALARQAQTQAAKGDRQLLLPAMLGDDPFEASQAWLQSLEEMPGRHQILLCIDEFERLEDLFPGNRREFLQLMGLFRSIIQHHRRVRLLISGVAPFTELSEVWNDHFINVRQLHIEHLEQGAALELLTHPTADFPPDAIPLDVAAEIMQRTGGQPYLLQLYASELVFYLNSKEHHQANLSDVAIIEDEILAQASPYFEYIFQTAIPQAKIALEAFANGKVINLNLPTRKWLKHRCLLTQEGTLSIPVFEVWLRQELGF